MELLLVAEISFCNPNNDYTYRWQIDGFESSEIGNVLGNSLKLPGDSFDAGKSIVVTVNALNNESLTMATVSKLSHHLFNLRIFDFAGDSTCEVSF